MFNTFAEHIHVPVSIEDNVQNEKISLSSDEWIKKLCTSQPQADFPLQGGHVRGNAFVKNSLTAFLLEWGWQQDNPDSAPAPIYTT